MVDHHATLHRIIVERSAPPDEVVFHYVRAVLGDCGGNISATARRIGIHRRTLQRMLQRSYPKPRAAEGADGH